PTNLPQPLVNDALLQIALIEYRYDGAAIVPDLALTLGHAADTLGGLACDADGCWLATNDQYATVYLDHIDLKTEGAPSIKTFKFAQGINIGSGALTLDAEGRPVVTVMFSSVTELAGSTENAHDSPGAFLARVDRQGALG